MVYVCEKHMIKGLQKIHVPHVDKVPSSSKLLCEFCTNQAFYKLFRFSLNRPKHDWISAQR
jgi:hypothetical protein